MKTDDIFEAITDIDDKFIAETRPIDLTDDQTAIAYPAVKKPLWKTLVPLAAGIAVLCAAGAFGAKYYTERLRSDPSESGSTSFSQLSVSAQNVTKIDIPDDGSEAVFTMEEFPEFSFRVSNKAVMGTLILPPEYDLAVEKCLFDDTIGILDLYLADLNGDGKRELCASVYEAHKGHGIMVSDFENGLVYNEDVGAITVYPKNEKSWWYTLPSDGREFEYSLAEEDGVLKAVKTVWQPSYSSTIPNELSRETLTLDMMTKMNNATDFKEISIPRSGVPNFFEMEEFPTYKFAATPTAVLLNSFAMSVVDVPIISGDSIENLFLCDLNGDGRRELCATVINNGIRSVEVVDFMNSKQYTLQGVQNSMYRHEYNLVAAGEELKLVERQQTGDLLVSDTTLTLDMMTPILSNTDLTKIEGEKMFKLAEFSDKTFEVTEHCIVMSDITTPDAMIRSVINGLDYYLTDLNGDGNREICSWDTIGSGIVRDHIEVYDIANDEHYMYVGGTINEWLSLDVKDGALYAVTRGYQDNKETSRQPLSLDILEKVEKSDTAFEEVPLALDQTFTMEDFPGFTFTVDTSCGTEYPQFTFGWGSSSASNHVNAVYLCDLDGDGKREIVMNCPFVDDGCIRVYGFMDNGEMGEAIYFENGGCRLESERDGTLIYRTNDKIEPFKFSKSDLKPIFAHNYFYQLLDWDHTFDFTEILPELGAYDVTIEERTLKISRRGGETIFDSGIQLQDLYSIPDMENNSVVLLYITESVGDGDSMVGAVKLSEKSAERYDFEKGVSIKPTTDELLLVNADGSEEPFRFPDSGTSLLQ